MIRWRAALDELRFMAYAALLGVGVAALLIAIFHFTLAPVPPGPTP